MLYSNFLPGLRGLHCPMDFGGLFFTVFFSSGPLYVYIVEFDSLTEKLKMIDISFLPVISIQTLAFLKLGSPMGMGMVPELPQMSGGLEKISND